mmetsp:Transcript_29594/g.40868  ORF Transcript_29594/g.40868 Transcript_29594/m.40868 type:complete len:523 (-) Transcript_29594:171-1739(-)
MMTAVAKVGCIYAPRVSSNRGRLSPSLARAVPSSALHSSHSSPRVACLKPSRSKFSSSPSFPAPPQHFSRSSIRKNHRAADVVTTAGMDVLVVGSGGREHALVWKLVQSPDCERLFCAPGNPGISKEPKVTCLGGAQLDVDNNDAVVAFCREKSIGLVVIGPEAPLVAGLADSLKAAGVPVFGPSQAAAQLEGSKEFMKDICSKYGINTAKYEAFSDVEAAKAYIRAEGAPIVVKADGLAAGKGVIVCFTEQEAEEAVEGMLVGGSFGEAGGRVVIEEFMEGEEASFFAVTDGVNTVPLVSAQDHKAVGEGDTGLNTGGMGAYSPAPIVGPEMQAQIMKDIVLPTVAGMREEGVPFSGVLFAGLMIQDGLPRLLEYNARFGDPECQTMMMRLESDVLPLLLAAAEGRLDQLPELLWSPDTAMLVVYAANGYPGAYQKGSAIGGLEAAAQDGAVVFHAGTTLGEDGEVVAAGGRVLGVGARAQDVRQAAVQAYSALDAIHWPQGFCRRDIGWRAIKRLDDDKF